MTVAQPTTSPSAPGVPRSRKGPERRFDYDEAARLRAEGETVAALALRYGVSLSAIRYATERHTRARMIARGARWQRENVPGAGSCVRCGCAISLWTVRYATGRCLACVHADNTRTVRADTLLCTCCNEWKPDPAFSPSRASKARRGRHSECKSCAAARKRAMRARNRKATGGESTPRKERASTARRGRIAMPPRLTDDQLRVLAVVDHRALPTGSVAAVAGLSRAKTESALNRLAERGLIARSETGRWHRKEAA